MFRLGFDMDSITTSSTRDMDSITNWIIAISTFFMTIATIGNFIIIFRLSKRDVQREKQIGALQAMAENLIQGFKFEKDKRKADIKPHFISDVNIKGKSITDFINKWQTIMLVNRGGKALKVRNSVSNDLRFQMKKLSAPIVNYDYTISLEYLCVSKKQNPDEENLDFYPFIFFEDSDGNSYKQKLRICYDVGLYELHDPVEIQKTQTNKY